MHPLRTCSFSFLCGSVLIALAALVLGCGTRQPPTVGVEGPSQPAPVEPGRDDKAAPPKSAPNTLTPREIALGYLLLFDGESTLGWDVAGQAKVENGLLVIGGDKASRAGPRMKFAKAKGTFDARWDGKEAPILEYTEEIFGIKKSLGVGRGRFETVDDLSANAFRLSLNQGDGGTVTAWITERPFTLGVTAGTKVMVRNAKLKIEKPESLFTGTDLKGWKHLAGQAITVTPEGWLHFKGASGLLTPDPFSHFLLQLECQVKSEKCNAALVLRGSEEDPESGYIIQLNNDWLAAPGKEYTLEKFDPKTNEKTATEKLMSLAKDFGLGGIKPHQPARKQIAEGKGSFHLAVAVCERDFAVWVNGVPVTDWTDHRPKADDARKGYREKGPICLRVLDADTELLVRHVRVTKMLKEELTKDEVRNQLHRGEWRLDKKDE